MAVARALDNDAHLVGDGNAGRAARLGEALAHLGSKGVAIGAPLGAWPAVEIEGDGGRGGGVGLGSGSQQESRVQDQRPE